MPIREVRIQNFKAFAESGHLKFGPLTSLVGPNDAGKSAFLHALRTFFEPPKKGGLQVEDMHGKDPFSIAKIEVAFDPSKLTSTQVQVDAKNKIDVASDGLVDAQGLLRLRLSLSTKAVVAFEILISDIDDDDLFPLALKRQDELVALLKARGHTAKKSGAETNQHRRGTLRSEAIEAGRGNREQWVDGSSIEKAVREILPTFIFFTDVSDFSIGITSVQNQFRGVVDRALANHPVAAQIEADIASTIQAEFDKVQEHLSLLTPSVTTLVADPKVNWKKAVDAIGLRWSDQAGLDLPFESRGAGTRRLFMVAYFQYEVAEAIRDPSGPRYVFAIEEPEVHLHPGAQRSLVTALAELSALGHAVVFTTHSPVFASLSPVEALVLVTRSGLHSSAQQVPAIDTVQVARELGVEASDRLVGRNHVILVEGQTDASFYEVLLGVLFRDGHLLLDPGQVLFLQCGGVGNLRFVATTECIAKAGLRWAVIADSDRPRPGAPPGVCQQVLVANPPATCCHVKVLERTSIENYLDPVAIKAVTGLECLVPQYGRLTAPDGTPLRRASWDAIKDAASKIAAQMSAADHIAASRDAKGCCEWIDMFSDLKAALGL